MLVNLRPVGRRYDTISFLTDYGTADEFVGVVKAVIRDIAPHAVVIDLTHAIAPYDVRAGSLALARAVPYVPSGIVLAVVDPGVGTSRRSIAVEVADGEGVMIGPDNGLLAPAVAMAGGAGRAVVLSNVEYQLATPGATFAGRDVFAPAAAHLCNGVDLYDLGEPIDADALLPGTIPLPRDEGGGLVAEVLWVDRFGNCQINVGPDEIADWGDRVRLVAGSVNRIATRADTFADLGPGTVGLVVDGSGMLAFVLDQRSAAEELSIGAGSAVTISPLGDDDAPASVTTQVAMSVTRDRPNGHR